jgi:CheY-like chemotaxis protein
VKKTIIADALKDFVQQHVSVLAKYGNMVFYARSGGEALTVHKKEKADLIIIQPDFPDMTCEKLCSIIRGDEELRKVSILMVCSNGPGDIERCRNCRTNDYIQPLTPETFLRKTLSLLNVSERTRYRVIVKVSSRAGNNMMDVLCTSQDISTSGILLETDRVLNKGDLITCSFFLPNSIKITAEGEIMRIANKEDGLKNYGVKFIDVPSEVESQITVFVDNWQKRKRRFR